MNIYLTEPGMILRKKGGKYVVEKNEEVIREIPGQLVDTVNIYSGATITSKCIGTLIEQGIQIYWFDSSNNLIGNIENIKTNKSELIEKQVDISKMESLKLELCKKIIRAKMSNGIIILKRFNRTRKSEKIEECIKQIKCIIKSIERQKSILNIYGIEGIASREYFKGVREIVGRDYMNDGRNRRPAKDPFNSLLNFGYSILYSEIIYLIKKNGLSPYYGFMHYTRNGHASLASDIMEEFRYQIVDAVCINIAVNKTFKVEDFSVNYTNGGVYLNNLLRKEYVRKIIEKINSVHRYNGSDETYRETIEKQIISYKKILNEKNAEIYQEFMIR